MLTTLWAALVFGSLLMGVWYLCRLFLPEGSRRSGCCPDASTIYDLEEVIRQECVLRQEKQRREGAGNV
ncbi:MAG: hypothetical protein LBR29_04350 [Methylobacteriaceae bacterium]|nr:hypothetical protein [Methylobacteriaceae bacterium]